MDNSTVIGNVSNETVAEIWLNTTLTKECSAFNRWSYYISLSISFCLGFFPNITAIVLLIKDLKKNPIPTIVLIFCLCLADLMSVCNYLLWTIIAVEIPGMPSPTCEIQSILNPFLPILTGIMSVFLALDRLIALQFPFFYQNLTVSKLFLYMFVITTLIFIFCCFPLFGLGNIWELVKKDGKATYKCELFFSKDIPHQRIFGYGFVALGFLIIITIVALNIFVLVIAIRLHKTLNGLQISSSESRIKLSYELHFAKLVGALTFVFVVCWAPFNVQILLQEMGIRTDPEVVGMIHSLAGLNYVIDPFVYIFTRKSIRRRLAKLCCRCNNQINPIADTEMVQ